MDERKLINHLDKFRFHDPAYGPGYHWSQNDLNGGSVWAWVHPKMDGYDYEAEKSKVIGRGEDTLEAARREVLRLREGLRTMKCDSCGGNGDCVDGSTNRMTFCRNCDGTGIHPRARAVLESL